MGTSVSRIRCFVAELNEDEIHDFMVVVLVVEGLDCR